jgi:hypothetical protein
MSLPAGFGSVREPPDRERIDAMVEVVDGLVTTHGFQRTSVEIRETQMDKVWDLVRVTVTVTQQVPTLGQREFPNQPAITELIAAINRAVWLHGFGTTATTIQEQLEGHDWKPPAVIMTLVQLEPDVADVGEE